MGADTATLTESLDCLRNRWKDFVGEVLHGEYAVWLGSGISRERFPNLGQLLERLLESLHSQIQTSDANCPFRRCLENVIGLTTVRPNNVFVASPKDWATDDGQPALKEIIDQLWGKYPEALDQTVRVGSQTLTATFHLLKLHEVYGDASKTPDAEHRFVALLIAEGILDELVTTNWDALIEAAHEACGENLDRSLKVIAASEEIDRSRVAGRARLSKIHGCARKTLAEQQASPDQRRYQRHMVTTRFEITAWINLPEFAPFRDLVRQVLRERPALFVGLSGQDLNLQAECFATFMAVPAPTEKQPRVIFSTSALEPAHKGFLKALYGAERYAANEETFTKEAALELRGKPLLGTLYVLTLLFKAHKFAERGCVEFGNDELGQPWFDFVEQGRRQWQEFLSHRYDAAADANDPHRAWRQLAEELPRVVTRFVTMYRDLTVLASPTAYRALDNRHLGMLKSSPNLSELNYHWLMLVLKQAIASGYL